MTLWGNLRAALLKGLTRLGDDTAERVVNSALIALVAVGMFLRVRGMFKDVLPLWLDEAAWAMQLIDWPLTQPSIRPIGFMAVSKALAHAFGTSEIPLRALPFVAGIAATAMAPFLAKRLFQWSGARLFFVAIIALHPGAIDLTKEFKPYSVAFALHTALVLLALRYVASLRGRHLAQALAIAVPAVFFTQDVVFAYPGVFLVLAISAIRAKKRSHLLTVSLSAAATFAIIVATYFLMWRTVSQAEPPSYWGNKYDVFFVPDAEHPEHTQLGWTLRKYFEVTGFPGLRRNAWGKIVTGPVLEEATTLDGQLWFCLHVIGLFAIAIRRRWNEALLLVLPLLVAVFFNWIGRFPFAVFRTDLFLLAYVAPIAAMALDRPASAPERWWALVPATLVVLLPLFALERNWHRDKTFLSVSAGMPSAIQRLLRVDRNSESPTKLLLMDEWLCIEWAYYTRYHPVYTRLLQDYPNFEVECSYDRDHFAHFVRSRLRRSKEPAWLMASNSRAMRRAMNGALADFDLQVVSRDYFVSIYRVQRE